MPADLPAKKPSYVQRLKQQIADNNFSAPTQTSPTTTPPTKSNVIDFLRQEVQNPPKTASSTLPVSPQTTTPSQKKSNIIDFAQEKAKRANASFSSSLASSLASSQPTGPFFSLEQLNPQTAIVLASVANGLQKEQFVNLLNGPLKNVLLTAAKIPSYDSRAIEKFSQQAEQEYEQFYQQLASEYKPSLADAKFKEQARQIIFSDQEISRLGEEISQTTRDLIDSTQPETFIQNYFQKKGSASPSSSQTDANSIKEDVSQQKKAQGELAVEKDLSKETETEKKLSSSDSSTTSAEGSSSSRNRSQESISSETAPSSTSSATSQSSSPQTSSPAEEPVSTEEKPSRLQQIRQAVKQQAESPQEVSPSRETVISPESAAAASDAIATTSPSSSADTPASSPTNISEASATGSPLKPEPTVSSPTSSPQTSSPAEEPVSTEEKPSRLQQIRQAVKQQAESPQEVSPSRETVISPESAAAASDAIATTSPSSSADTPASSPTNISEASATGSPLKPEPTVSSPTSSPQTSFSSQKRSPFVRRKALASQTKSKLSPQNRLQNKAKKVAKKALQKALQVLGQFLASILPYIWPLLLGLGTIIAATALATGGVATVVSSGAAVWTAVTAWVSSTFGPFDNAAVQLANQSPLVNKICAQCLTITKTVSLKGGLDTTGEAIDANNAKRAYFTYTITPNTKECSDIKLNGECSDLISVACKNINSESCPGLDPVNYQVPAPLTDVTSNSAATKDIPTNYALNTNITSGISEDGNLDIPACNALLRALKTDNLDNYSLTKPITFNLEEFLPNGYPLPYGDDYRLDNAFTLGYSGQPTNQYGEGPTEDYSEGESIDGLCWPVTPTSVDSGPFTRKVSHRDSLDLGAPAGTKIYAPLAGTYEYWTEAKGCNAKTSFTWKDGQSYTVIFKHMTYENSSRHICKNGTEELSVGDVIGTVDDTGNSTYNHLHLEIAQNGQSTTWETAMIWKVFNKGVVPSVIECQGPVYRRKFYCPDLPIEKIKSNLCNQ